MSNFSTTFPANVSSGVVSGLLGGLQYQFSVSVTLRVGGQLYMSVPGPLMSDIGSKCIPGVYNCESSVEFCMTVYSSNIHNYRCGTAVLKYFFETKASQILLTVSLMITN